MTKSHLVKLILGVSLPSFTIVFVAIFIFVFCRRRESGEHQNHDVESPDQNQEFSDSGFETEELVTFYGGEDLTICDILDAPGEVIGKSSYGTLYKASLQRSGRVRVLRFLRPICALRSGTKEFNGVIEMLGLIRHENLVPLLGFYAGTRGEKLMVHPFFSYGNLSEFIRSGDAESHKWSNIMSITIGIAKALDHLHTGMLKPIVHGNLKSKNVLLDSNVRPHVSDFGLHVILNPSAGQEILEASASEGYKAPELIKMKDVSKESDVYSFGVIMLELVSGKEPISKNHLTDHDDDDDDDDNGDDDDDVFHLPDLMRNAVLDHRLSDLYRPEIMGSDEVTEERVLKYFQLGMACCSPSPSLRPSIKHVLRKLQDLCFCS